MVGSWLVVEAVFFLATFDDNSAREDQNVVLSRRDVDAVSIGDGQPALGDFGDDLPAMREGIPVVGEVALSLQIVWAMVVVHREAMAEQREERFLDNSLQLAAAMDFVGRAPGEPLLLHDGQVVAIPVLKDQSIAQREEFPIDKERVIPIGVLDREIGT